MPRPDSVTASHPRRHPKQMEAVLIQISPMYPLNRQQLGTFRKEREQPYCRFFLACVAAVLILSTIGGAALCATRLAEIERYHAAAARV